MCDEAAFCLRMKLERVHVSKIFKWTNGVQYAEPAPSGNIL